MKIQEFNGKTVCILGYGREGKAMVDALEKYAPDAKVTIADKNYEFGIMNYELQTGEDYLKNLDRFDVVIKSPGIPPKELLETRNSKLTSSTQIFLDTIADSGAVVIGVTGSKGKSTTSSLIHHILSQDSKLGTRN